MACSLHPRRRSTTATRSSCPRTRPCSFTAACTHKTTSFSATSGADVGALVQCAMFADEVHNAQTAHEGGNRAAVHHRHLCLRRYGAQHADTEHAPRLLDGVRLLRLCMHAHSAHSGMRRIQGEMVTLLGMAALVITLLSCEHPCWQPCRAVPAFLKLPHAVQRRASSYTTTRQRMAHTATTRHWRVTANTCVTQQMH